MICNMCCVEKINDLSFFLSCMVQNCFTVQEEINGVCRNRSIEDKSQEMEDHFLSYLTTIHQILLIKYRQLESTTVKGLYNETVSHKCSMSEQEQLLPHLSYFSFCALCKTLPLVILQI